MAKIDKLLSSAKEHLEPNEQVLAVILGAYETKLMKNDTVRNGIFIATEKRAVFYAKKMFGYDMEVFPYTNISSIEVSKGFMGHSINLFASGNKVKMKWINDGDIAKFIEIVKERIQKKDASLQVAATVNNHDVADQIAKLASLKDQGILTEEEFSAKKKQLLGI
ncbi:PH domain-containing protein [Bacillus rhizoplanae]|uniref:PH domain-containing protein n=1 Tax=Bacillus rhizoplanae TaxID=2880966 RepID=UPI003D20F0B5